MGDYAIVPSVTGATLDNYTVVPVNGKLTVGKATLTVTAYSFIKEYSLLYNFAGTEFTTNGLVNSDVVNTVTLASAGAAAAAAVGQYEILISGAVGSGRFRPNFFMREIRVVGLSPSNSAAPPAP